LNKIAYCYSIIDNNNRISLPFSGQINDNPNKFFSSEKESLNVPNNSQSNEVIKPNYNPLDSFFPFDPYLLIRSKIFIQKYYQDFNDIKDEEESLSDDEESGVDDDEDDNDDDGNENNDESDDVVNKYDKRNFE